MQRRRVRPGNPFLMGGRIFKVPGGVRPGRPLGSLGGPRAEDGSDLLSESGQPLFPYDEHETWGTNLPPGSTPPMPPVVGAPPVPAQQSQPGFLPALAPFSKSDPAAGVGWKWSNPTTASSVPIIASSPSQQPILTLNYQRNMLIIQNNSTATAPDTTPTFYVGFNAPVPSAGFGLALPAGVGIAFDIICPRDAIYILQSGGGGATLVVAGTVVQGTFAPQ